MKISLLTQIVLMAPVAVCLAQTPPKPAPAPPAPAAPATPAMPAATPKPALTLEDIPGTDPVVISVGDEKMTRSEFERLIASLPDQVRARAQGPGKRQVAEQIVQLKSMAQEARKRGLDKSQEAKQMIAFQTDNVLANALYKEMSANIKPDDAAARAYYDKHKSEYEEVTARHILIRFKGSPVPVRPNEKDLTEEEALAKTQDLRKKLLAGEDFAKLAAANSDDVQSGAQGGSLGSFTHGRMVPVFEETAFKLPVGEVSEPVKSQFGYHLIKVEKHSTSDFDAVKMTIEQKLKPEMAQQAVENVRKQAAITMNEAYFSK